MISATVLLLIVALSLSFVSLPSRAAATTLKLTPVRGIIGTHVVVTGRGYPANSMVTLTHFVTKTCPTNSTGGITNCSFSVPNDPPGAYLITASGGGVGANSKFTIGSRAHVTPVPNSGHAGSKLTINGAHFGWNTKIISVYFNNVKVATSPSSVTTSGTGSFSLSINVPNDKPNAYVVTVKDALGYVANTVYTIT